MSSKSEAGCSSSQIDLGSTSSPTVNILFKRPMPCTGSEVEFGSKESLDSVVKNCSPRRHRRHRRRREHLDHPISPSKFSENELNSSSQRKQNKGKKTYPSTRDLESERDSSFERLRNLYCSKPIPSAANVKTIPPNRKSKIDLTAIRSEISENRLGKTKIISTPTSVPIKESQTEVCQHSDSVQKSSMLLYSVKNPERHVSPAPLVKYFWQDSSAGKLLAVWSTKTPEQVYVYSLNGELKKKLDLKGSCLDVAWDPSGQFLATICSDSSKILIWNSETDIIELTPSKLHDGSGCLAWRPFGKFLAYATAKGNLFTFDQTNREFSRIIGIHTRKIIGLAWSNCGFLALISDDALKFSVSPFEETADMQTVKLPGTPSGLKFGQLNWNNCKAGVDNAISAIINSKAIFVLKIDEDELTGMNFGFISDYGLIKSYQWRCDESILILFSYGLFLTISTRQNDFGEQLWVTKLSAEVFCSSMCNNLASTMAVCFQNTFEIREGYDLSVITAKETFKSCCVPVSCSISGNGQFLAVLTKCGDLQVYLIGVSLLGDSSGTHIVNLVSLDKILIQTFAPNLKEEKILKLTIQPDMLIVGPLHFCVVLDNRALFYHIRDVLKDGIDKPRYVRTYKFPVQRISLNHTYCACKYDDILFLHLISEEGVTPEVASEVDQEVVTETTAVDTSAETHEKPHSKNCQYFPGINSAGLTRINCFVLTKDLLIFGGNAGMVRIFELKKKLERPVVTTSTSPITHIIPDITESILVITDEDNKGSIYDIGNNLSYSIPDFPTSCDGILWESDIPSKHIFMTYSLGCLYVNIFIFWQKAGLDTVVYKVGNFKAFDSLAILPLCLKDSIVYSQSPSGCIKQNGPIWEDQPEYSDPEFGTLAKIENLFALKKFLTIVQFCEDYEINELWGKLAEQALVNLDFETAIQAYLKDGEVGIAVDLDALSEVEDIELILGHISLIHGNYEKAETHYLKSSESGEMSAAVLLKIYTQQFDSAFDLAKECSPNLIPMISKEFALVEEGRGNYIQAMQLFQDSVKHPASTSMNPEELAECKAGLARNYIRCGQYERGLELVKTFNERKHILNCLDVLVSKKHYDEAVTLFEFHEEWDKAASIHIIQKNWALFDAMIPNITSQEIFRQYSHAKEIDGQFLEAAFAFERIGDLNNACRVFLKANQPDEAIRLAKMNKSFDTVKTCCNYFLERGDVGTAMRFLVVSGQFLEAVPLALTYDRIDLYASTLLEFSPETRPFRISEEFRPSLQMIGNFCKDMKEGVSAARCFLLIGNPIAALQVLLDTARHADIPDERDFLNLMIETAQSFRYKELTKLINAYYSGELDNEPKDPRLQLKFALELEYFSVASKLSLIVAKKEQESGNYLAARCILLRVCMELKYKDNKIPKANLRALEILHIYVLSRIHLSLGNCDTAGRLLARLSKCAEEFPAHLVQLLTSATIQCSKAGLKASAINACFAVMAPENRPYIDPKFLKKFELMLRKFGKATLEDKPDELSPCPFCQELIPNFQLDCTQCGFLIPFCIASGRHVTDELTCCPSCSFPAIYSEFEVFLQDKELAICPMCEVSLSPKDLFRILKPDEFLYTFVPRENVPHKNKSVRKRKSKGKTYLEQEPKFY